MIKNSIRSCLTILCLLELKPPPSNSNTMVFALGYILLKCCFHVISMLSQTNSEVSWLEPSVMYPKFLTTSKIP